MNFWLMKSEPGSYSIDDLKRDVETDWNGVRNYQARNFMRTMKRGEKILFYHSGANPPAVVGVARVSQEAHPDTTALDPKHKNYDPKATREKPIWEMVSIAFEGTFSRAVSIGEIKKEKRLSGIMLAQPGSRLSVQPVSQKHFEIIEELSTQ